MSIRNMTGREIKMAIEAAARDIDQTALREDIHMRIAADHVVDCKLKMIDAVNDLHAHLHGNAPAPCVRASVRFNPNEPENRASLHYIFKALYSGMPWEVPIRHLVAPLAMSLVLQDLLDELFPCPAVTDAKYAYQRFVDLIAMPVYREGVADPERARQRDHYFREMEWCENELKRVYAELSKHFLALEEPRTNPDRGKFEKIYRNTESLADEFCVKEKPASFVVQEKALVLWKQYKNSTEVKARCCRKDHRVTYADVYDHCRRLLNDLGVASAAAFEKAVTAALRREKRLAKRQ